MQTIVIVNLFVILIAFFARFKQVKYVLELAFLIIFFITAFRYNYGTDYSNYHGIFDEIAAFSNIFAIDPSFFAAEKGWLIVCFFFKPIGFFGMIFVLSAFFCYTYYSLIKKYVHENYYWLAVLLYVFTIDIMLIQFSAIRQATAIAMFLFSIRYLVEEKSPIKYLIINMLAGTIHSSAYFMLIFVIFAFVKDWKTNKVGYVILIGFFILLFAGRFLMNYMPAISTVFAGDRYTDIFDADTNSTNTLFGGAFWSILFLIVLYYSRNQDDKFKYLFLFYSVFFMSYMLTNLVWIGERIGYYFAPFSIIVLPQLLSSVKYKIVKYGILALFLMLIFNKLMSFYTYDYFEEGFENYQTIFSLL